MAEEQDETTSMEPLPATLSDNYFELDKQNLTELENAESIDLMLCMSQKPDGGGSMDESSLITETSSLKPQDDSIVSQPSRHHHPQQLTTKPVAKPMVTYHQQAARKLLLAGQLPCIKTPSLSPLFSTPPSPSLILKNPVLVHQPQPTHLHHLHQPVKKVRAGE